MFGTYVVPLCAVRRPSGAVRKALARTVSVAESAPLRELPFGSESPNSATSSGGCRLRSQSALPNVLAPCWMARCVQRAIDQAVAFATWRHRETRNDQEAILAFSP